MKKGWFLLFSMVAFILLIVSVSFAEEIPVFFWGKNKYKIRTDYNQQTNTTSISVTVRRGEGYDREKYSVSLSGFVKVKRAQNFCGTHRDAVVLISHEGSGGHMRYNVFGINSRTGKLIRIPGPTWEIPAGEVVPADGGFFVFRGVRYSTAYFKRGYVVEEKPLMTIVKKDVPSIIFSQRADGTIETFPPDLSAKGIYVRRGQKLFFLRNDFYEPLEDIRCEGLVMELPPDEPCARTFPDAGKGFITIEIERNIIKIPLAVE